MEAIYNRDNRTVQYTLQSTLWAVIFVFVVILPLLLLLLMSQRFLVAGVAHFIIWHCDKNLQHITQLQQCRQQPQQQQQ